MTRYEPRGVERLFHKPTPDHERIKRYLEWSWLSKGIHVYYTYRADLPRKKVWKGKHKRVFHQHFANTREYTAWWVAFHNLVVIGGEKWPRQWARTPSYQPVHPNEKDLGAKRT